MNDDTIDLPAPIVPGVARALSPLVRRIALDVGGQAGPNTYLVGIDEIAIIDPGPDAAHHLDAIAGCGGDRIMWILSTGAVDAAGAVELGRRTGAEVLEPADGLNVLGTEFRLTAMALPTMGDPRIAYFLEEERVLFAGDYFAEDMSSTAADPTGFTDTLAGLRRKRLRAVAPSAGHLIENPNPLIEKLVAG
ncbi:MAG: hypothetical protein ACXIVQ_02915 [Acidimicrobiales bacterium]